MPYKPHRSLGASPGWEAAACYFSCCPFPTRYCFLGGYLNGISVEGSRWAEKQPTSERRGLDSNPAVGEGQRDGGGVLTTFCLDLSLRISNLFPTSPRMYITALPLSSLSKSKPIYSLTSSKEIFISQHRIYFLTSSCSFPFSSCQVFGQPTIHVGRPDVALGQRCWCWFAGLSWEPCGPAELSCGWSREPQCPVLAHGVVACVVTAFSVCCFLGVTNWQGTVVQRLLGSEREWRENPVLPASSPRINSYHPKKIALLLLF